MTICMGLNVDVKLRSPSRTPLWCTHRYIHIDTNTPSRGLWFSPCKRMGNISNNISKNISYLIPSMLKTFMQHDYI